MSVIDIYIYIYIKLTMHSIYIYTSIQFMSMTAMSNATFCEVWNFRFFKPKLSIQHISWSGKQSQCIFSNPWLQTCHTPAPCLPRSTRTVQTGRQQSCVTHFRSIVSGAVMDVSVCLFAECIDNRAQSGPIPWFMSTPPFKNINLIGSVCWNWRGKCQPNCKSLGHREQHAMVLDWVIHGDISKRFNKEMLLRRGVGRKKKCGQRREEYAQSRRLQTTQRIQLRIGSRFAWHFVQWLRLKRTTAWSRRCNDLSSNGRNCKPKGEANVYWSSWTQQ